MAGTNGEHDVALLVERVGVMQERLDVISPKVDDLKLWQQRIIGGMAVIVAILVPTLVGVLSWFIQGRNAGPH